MEDVQADSSPAPVEPSDRLAALGDVQLSEWRKTGKLPDESSSSDAESTPAKPVEQAALTGAILEQPSEAAKPKPKGVKARNAELEAEIQSLNEKLRIRKELESELNRRGIKDVKPAESSQAPVAAVDTEPTVDQFDTYEKFVKAQARWEARQEFESRQKVDREQQQFRSVVESVTTQAAAFSDKLNAAATADPAFKARLLGSEVAAWRPASDVILAHRAQGLPAPVITVENAIAQEVLESPMSVELLDHLVQHPDVVALLRTATDKPTLKRLVGRLEGRLERDDKTPVPVKTITGAPAVPSTFVGSRSTTSVDAVKHALDTGDFVTYKAAMNQRELAARGKR